MKTKNDKDLFLGQCNNIFNHITDNILEKCYEITIHNGVQTGNKNDKDHTRNCLKECNRCIVMKSGFCSSEHSDLFYSQRTKN
jgi:hypothetical protein